MWKDIKHYEGLYKVSDNGEIWSYPKTWKSNNGGTNNHNGKKLKGGLASTGYYQVSLTTDKQSKNYYIHRLVAETFIANPENHPFINHKDGNKINNNISNLEWCTPQENETHALKTGLKPSGENHGWAKLKEIDIVQIFKLSKEGKSQTEIANIYNIKQATISCILKRKTWKKVII